MILFKYMNCHLKICIVSNQLLEALIVKLSPAQITSLYILRHAVESQRFKNESFRTLSIRNAHCRISFNSLVRLKITIYTMRRQGVIPRTKRHAWTSLSKILILSSRFRWSFMDGRFMPSLFHKSIFHNQFVLIIYS